MSGPGKRCPWHHPPRANGGLSALSIYSISYRGRKGDLSEMNIFVYYFRWFLVSDIEITGFLCLVVNYTTLIGKSDYMITFVFNFIIYDYGHL